MHGQLHVRHLHGDLRLAADGDDLVDRVPEGAVLAADVADVASARSGGDARQFQDLRARGEDAGVVLEPARQTERARLHLLGEQLTHPCDFVRPGVAPEVLAHHLPAQEAVPGIRGHVDRHRLAVQAGEEIGEGPGRAAVLAHHDRGDPLAHRGEGVGMLEQAAVAVAVGVDEARGQDEAFRVDDGLAGRGRKRAHLRDAVAPHAHRGRAPRRARAVDHDGIDDQQGRRQDREHG